MMTPASSTAARTTNRTTTGTALNFCTLFDKNFLTRGIALHASLARHCPAGFTLWMLCMDDESYAMMAKLSLPNTHLLKISEVEDSRMTAVKPGRTSVEYCWMWSSALPLYLLEKNPTLDMIAYIDADIYFYAPPDEIYRELASDSILIIPHNYSPTEKHRERTSGIYNVGMMIFRNDTNALEALHWWKDRVIEWCYARYEVDSAGKGKFGDQLYLNDWPTRFKGVHVLENRGANVASWNIETYDRARWPLIFYHFHGLKIYMARTGRIKVYPVTVRDRRIYGPYLDALQTAYDKARGIDPSWSLGCAEPLDILRRIKQHIGL